MSDATANYAKRAWYCMACSGRVIWCGSYLGWQHSIEPDDGHAAWAATFAEARDE